ncbi:hypothetical protein CLOM_g3619 [Closterium sp. NIES-68]|nr:hypothetical protein CLOM_g3619 [Closterium sp. NIES-68]GJP63691.1 hypothetical protein CLOP_g20750 [Closterium sp. NIES-67]
MAEEAKTASSGSFSIAEARKWVVENKLRTVGGLWASGIAGSVLYNMRKPGEKMSVKIIHARLHAQAFTLAALLAAAGVEYWEHSSNPTKKDARQPL